MHLAKKIVATSLLTFTLVNAGLAMTCPKAKEIQFNANAGWIVKNSPDWNILYAPSEQDSQKKIFFVEAVMDTQSYYPNHIICGYVYPGSHFEIEQAKETSTPNPSMDHNWVEFSDGRFSCKSHHVNNCHFSNNE